MDKQTPPKSDTLSSQVLEYFTKYTGDQNLSSYLRGFVERREIEVRNVDQVQEPGVQLKPVDDGNSSLENDDKASRIDQTRDGNASPTSSLASNRKLEWDNGADIGYENSDNRVNLHKSFSLPALSTLEKIEQGKKPLKLDLEGNVENSVRLYFPSSSSSSDKLVKPSLTSETTTTNSLGGQKIDTTTSSSFAFKPWSSEVTSDVEIGNEKVTSFVKGTVGSPVAQSTPTNQRPLYKRGTSLEAPILCEGNSKVNITSRSDETLFIGAKSKNNKTENNKNENKKMKNNKTENNMVVTELKCVAKFTKSKIVKLAITKPITIDCINYIHYNDKDIQTIKCVQFESVAVQTESTDERINDIDNTIQNIPYGMEKQTVEYIKYSDSSDHPSSRSFGTNTVSDLVSNCNSFEYVCPTNPDDAEQEKDKKIDTCKNDFKSTESGSSKSSSNPETPNSNEPKSSSSEKTLSSNVTEASSKTTPLGEMISCNLSNHLNVDIEKSIALLQRLLKSKRYDKVTKEYFVKKIVEKILRSNYNSDSSSSINKYEKVPKNDFKNLPGNAGSSSSSKISEKLLEPSLKKRLQENIPWMPATFNKSAGFPKNLEIKTFSEDIIPDNKERRKVKDSRFTITSSIFDQKQLQGKVNLSNYLEPPLKISSEQPPLSSSTTNSSQNESKPRKSNIKTWKDDVTQSEKLLDSRYVKADGDKTDSLIKFAKKERESQLNWINNEITHLNKLRNLLQEKSISDNNNKTTNNKTTDNKNNTKNNKNNIHIEKPNVQIEVLTKPHIEDMKKMKKSAAVYVITTDKTTSYHHYNGAADKNVQSNSSNDLPPIGKYSRPATVLAPDMAEAKLISSEIYKSDKPFTCVRRYVFEIPVQCSCDKFPCKHEPELLRRVTPPPRPSNQNMENVFVEAKDIPSRESSVDQRSLVNEIYLNSANDPDNLLLNRASRTNPKHASFNSINRQSLDKFNRGIQSSDIEFDDNKRRVHSVAEVPHLPLNVSTVIHSQSAPTSGRSKSEEIATITLNRGNEASVIAPSTEIAYKVTQTSGEYQSLVEYHPPVVVQESTDTQDLPGFPTDYQAPPVDYQNAYESQDPYDYVGPQIRQTSSIMSDDQRAAAYRGSIRGSQGSTRDNQRSFLNPQRSGYRKSAVSYQKSAQDNRKSITDYQKSNQDYQKSDQDYQKSNEDYQKSNQDYQKSNQDYQKSNQDYQRFDQDYQRADLDYQKSDRDYQKSNQDYQRFDQDDNRSVTDHKKSIQDYQKSVQDSKRSVQNSQKSVIDRQKSGKDYQKSLTDRQRSLQDYNKSVTNQRSAEDYRKSAQDYNKSITDQRAVEDYRKSATDRQRSAQDYSKSATDQRSAADYRKSATDRQRSDQNYKKSVTDQESAQDYRKSITDKQRSIQDQQKSDRDYQTSTHDHQRSDTDYQRSGTEYRRSGTDYQRSDTNNQRSDTNKQRSDTDYQQAGTDYQRSGTDYQRFGTEYQRSGTDYQKSDTNNQRSDTDYQRSGTDYQRSGINNQRSAANYQKSGSDYRTPSINYQRSGVDYQRSGTSYQKSGTDYQRSPGDDREYNDDYPEPSDDYQEPLADYQGSSQQHQKPAAGYQDSTHSYQRSASDYQRLGSDYQRPASNYQRSGNDYQRPGSAHQRLDSEYQRSVRDYPDDDQQSPTNDYQEYPQDYIEPPREYQRTASDYREPVQDYTSSATDYQGSSRTKRSVSYQKPIRDQQRSATDYQKPTSDYQKYADDDQEYVHDYQEPPDEYQQKHGPEYRRSTLDYEESAPTYQKSQTDHKKHVTPTSSTSSTASTTTSSSQTILIKICPCCKRKNTKYKSVLQGLPQEIENSLCQPCHMNTTVTVDPISGQYKVFPDHICKCYTLMKTETVNKIKETVKQLEELEKENLYCNCAHQICKCSKIGRSKKGGIAYTLTLEDEDVLDYSEKETHRRSLDEIKLKVPRLRRPKYKRHDRKRPKKHHKKHKKDKSPSRMTLQEYLCANRPNFVQNAEERRKMLIELAYMREQRCQKYKELLAMTNGVIPNGYKDQTKKKGLFSSKEMKEITEKNYKKLPEVQRKLEERREKNIKKANKLLADIFNKKIQRNALKGKINLSTTTSVIKLI